MISTNLSLLSISSNRLLSTSTVDTTSDAVVNDNISQSVDKQHIRNIDTHHSTHPRIPDRLAVSLGSPPFIEETKRLSSSSTSSVTSSDSSQLSPVLVTKPNADKPKGRVTFADESVVSDRESLYQNYAYLDNAVPGRSSTSVDNTVNNGISDEQDHSRREHLIILFESLESQPSIIFLNLQTSIRTVRK
ncbi:hypothetical protein KIN20_021293, partial [Parelaphostrongylus tenuis]